MSKTQTQFKHECTVDNAPKFLDWIRNRGGVAVWKSINLSNPGASWSSPANNKDGTPMEKPSWQSTNTPVIFTNPDEIGVATDALFEAFPVALKQNGMFLHLTDGSQRRVDKALAECEEKHGDAFFRRGVLDIDRPSMGIYYTTEIISLTEWAAKQNPVA